MNIRQKALSVTLALAFGTLAASPVATVAPSATPKPKPTLSPSPMPSGKASKNAKPTTGSVGATGKMHTVYRDRDIAVESDDITSNIETGTFSTAHTLKVSRPGSDAVGDSGHGNYHDGTATLDGHVVVHDSGNAPEAHAAGAKTGQGPSTLTCDQLSVDSKRKIYIATGNVHYVQGDTSATSQSARLDLGAHTLDLEGDVHLSQGDNTMSAQTVHYDTLTKDVHSTGGPVTINGPAEAGPQPTPSAKATPTSTPRH